MPLLPPQRFAETKKIPADNAATIRYLHPITHQWEATTRDYCEVHRYGEAVRRWLKSSSHDHLKLQALFDRYKVRRNGTIIYSSFFSEISKKLILVCWTTLPPNGVFTPDPPP